MMTSADGFGKMVATKEAPPTVVEHLGGMAAEPERSTATMQSIASSPSCTPNLVIHVRDMPDYPDAVYVGRRNNRKRLPQSELANPFPISTPQNRRTVISRFRDRLHGLVFIGNEPTITALIDARGKPLACWCRRSGEAKTADNECHADVIAEMLATYSDDDLRAMVKGVGA